MITSLRLADFRSHRDTILEPLGRVNWFLGRNGTGKSSLIDAIAYAMTGVCRGTDRGGRGTESLTLDVPGYKVRGMSVSVAIDGAGFSRRATGEGPTSNQQIRIDGIVKVGAPLVQAMTDVTRILDVTPKEQQALLEQVIDVVVTPEIVKAALGPHAGAVEGRSLASLSDLLEAEEWARRQRTEVRRERERIHDPVDLPEWVTAEMRRWTKADADEALKRTDAKLRGLYEERGQNAGGRRKALATSAARLQQEIDLLAKTLRETPDPRSEILNIVADIARRSEVIAALKTAEPKGNEAEDLRRLELLRNHPGACWLCRRPWTKRQYSDLLDGATHDAEDHGQGILGLAEEQAAIKALDGKMSQLSLAEDKRNAFDRDIKAKGEQLLAIRAELTTLGEPSGADVDERIAKGEEVKQKISALAVMLYNNEKLAYAVEVADLEIGMWEEVVRVLSPGGLRSKLVGERLSVFQDKANILLNALGMKVQILTDPEFRILVNGRPSVALSESERMRVGLGLQMTLANLAGLRFVCVDRVDAFDADNLAALKDIARKVKQFQFFFCATSNKPEDFEADADWNVYEVSMTSGISAVKEIP